MMEEVTEQQPTFARPQLLCQNPNCPQDVKTAKISCAYCTDVPYRHYCSKECFYDDQDEHATCCQNTIGMLPKYVPINTFYFCCPRGQQKTSKFQNDYIEAFNPESMTWEPAKLEGEQEGEIVTVVFDRLKIRAQVSKQTIRPLRTHLLIQDTPRSLEKCTVCHNTIMKADSVYYYCPDCDDDFKSYKSSPDIGNVSVAPMKYNCCVRCWKTKNTEFTKQTVKIFVEAEASEGEDDDSPAGIKSNEITDVFDRLYSFGYIDLSKEMHRELLLKEKIRTYESKPQPFDTEGDNDSWKGSYVLHKESEHENWYKFKCKHETKATEYCMVYVDVLDLLLPAGDGPTFVKHAQYAVNIPSITRHMQQLRKMVYRQADDLHTDSENRQVLDTECVEIIFNIIGKMQRIFRWRERDAWMNDKQFTKQIMDERERYILFQTKKEKRKWNKIAKNDKIAQLVSFIAFCLTQNWHETERLVLLNRLCDDFKFYWVKNQERAITKKGANVRAITEYIESSLKNGNMLAACVQELKTVEVKKKDERAVQRLKSLEKIKGISVAAQEFSASTKKRPRPDSPGQASGTGLAGKAKQSRGNPSLVTPNYKQTMTPEQLANAHNHARDNLLGKHVSVLTLAALNQFEDKYGHELLNRPITDSMDERANLYGKDNRCKDFQAIIHIWTNAYASNQPPDSSSKKLNKLTVDEIKILIARIDKFLATMPCFERQKLEGSADRRKRVSYAYFWFIHFFMNATLRKKNIRNTLHAIFENAAGSAAKIESTHTDEFDVTKFSRWKLKNIKRKFLAKLTTLNQDSESNWTLAQERTAQQLMRRLTDIETNLTAMTELAKRQILRAMREKQLIETTVRRKMAELDVQDQAQKATSSEILQVQILIEEWQIQFLTTNANHIYNQREKRNIRQALHELIELKRNFENKPVPSTVFPEEAPDGMLHPSNPPPSEASRENLAGGAGLADGTGVAGGAEVTGDASKAGRAKVASGNRPTYRQIVGIDGVTYFQDVHTEILQLEKPANGTDVTQQGQIDEEDEQDADNSWISRSKSSFESGSFSSWIMVQENVSNEATPCFVWTSEQKYLDAQLSTLKQKDTISLLIANLDELTEQIEQSAATPVDENESLLRKATSDLIAARAKYISCGQEEERLLKILVKEEKGEDQDKDNVKEVLTLYESEDSEDGEDSDTEAPTEQQLIEQTRKRQEERRPEIEFVSKYVKAQKERVKSPVSERSEELGQLESLEKLYMSQLQMRVARLVLQYK